ncbi:MAG: hypothetical protein K8I00_12270, partial [Candidatus Omnitrophica bacterium]|nr:hypothetical protein [Candidatus Omnitrophota bacterium]
GYGAGFFSEEPGCAVRQQISRREELSLARSQKQERQVPQKKGTDAGISGTCPLFIFLRLPTGIPVLPSNFLLPIYKHHGPY